MTDYERRVVIDVSTADVVELVAVLGSFAAGHDVRIDFIRVPDSEETQQWPNFNPDLVQYMGGEGEPLVPVITRTNFRAFSRNTNGDTSTGQSFFSALDRLFSYPGEAHRDSVNRELAAPCLKFTKDEHLLGIKALRAREFLERLKSGTFEKIGIGEKGVLYFEAFCAALILTNEEE